MDWDYDTAARAAYDWKHERTDTAECAGLIDVVMERYPNVSTRMAFHDCVDEFLEEKGEPPLHIISRVLNAAYEETESWEDGNIGAELAYLAMAIADASISGGSGFVEWYRDDPFRLDVIKLFTALFPPHDPVWNYIVIHDTTT